MVRAAGKRTSVKTSKHTVDGNASTTSAPSPSQTARGRSSNVQGGRANLDTDGTQRERQSKQQRKTGQRASSCAAGSVVRNLPRKNAEQAPGHETVEAACAFCFQTGNKKAHDMAVEFTQKRRESMAGKTAESRSAHLANMERNRYKDVYCQNDFRVKLTWPAGEKNDYIHANYVEVDGRARYICTQAPLPGTVVDFWRMVWQERSPMIVMLCNLRERGKVACEAYWPQEVGGVMTVGQVTIKSTQRISLEDHLVATTLEISAEGETRTTEHTHWQNWPDRGVPDNYLGCMRLVKRIRELSESQKAGPVVVHCSAGIGRTGTIVGLDMAWGKLRRGENVDMDQIVADLRKCRLGSVQMDAQFLYMHRVLMSYAENIGAFQREKNATVPFYASYDEYMHLLAAQAQEKMKGKK